MTLVVILLSFYLSPNAIAQSYGTGDSTIFKFGNQEDGYYSGSFLSPVGQGAAGSDPHDVKTEFGFGMYSGKTAYDKGSESKNRDEKALNAQYKGQVYSLFTSDYFPNGSWNGTPLVEKVYSIIEGIKGDQVRAKSNSKKHRLLNPTNLADLKEWGNLTKEEDLKKVYREKYRVLMGEEPSLSQVDEFYKIFGAIQNSVPWSGLCNQFSAANANPYFNKTFTDLYGRDGEVYLCQKPITLGEVKEATTLLYDSIAFDQTMGGAVNFTPSGTPTDNFFDVEEMDFLKKYPPNTFIEGKDLDVYRKKYSNYIYKNYFDRLGKSPSGMNFCELDKKFASIDHRDFGNDKENMTKNKVPIMNLNGSGEVWNSAVTSVQRDVRMYNVYDGTTITESGIQASNSFSDLIQLYASKRLNGGVGTPEFKRLQKVLLRNYNVMCRYANDHGMSLSKSYCSQIISNETYDVPIPAGSNMDMWSSLPKTLSQRNQATDDALTGLALTFIVFDSNNKPAIDGKGLPRLRGENVPGSESTYFNNIKIQNVALNLEYVAQADFADTKKGAKKSKSNFDGLVVIDENVDPPQQTGCSWKNVWKYDENLKKYVSNVPSSFMTLDIPACPSDTKAKNLLDQVKKCATFKDFLKQYNKWMLEASQGFNPEKIKDEIDSYKLKFPQTNVDWTKLKTQILHDMDQSFVEESKQ
ncbi:MAG: hypothetical protein ACOYL6_10430 [Bacteriovoracaceae bacterium]